LQIYFCAPLRACLGIAMSGSYLPSRLKLQYAILSQNRNKLRSSPGDGLKDLNSRPVWY